MSQVQILPPLQSRNSRSEPGSRVTAGPASCSVSAGRLLTLRGDLPPLTVVARLQTDAGDLLTVDPEVEACQTFSLRSHGQRSRLDQPLTCRISGGGRREPDESGRRRLDDPNDYVVLEIKEAFEQRVPVVPVLVDERKCLLQASYPRT
jgi:hypothetical protein